VLLLLLPQLTVSKVAGLVTSTINLLLLLPLHLSVAGSMPLLSAVPCCHRCCCCCWFS
jgi:hypothetical protein